MLGLTQNALAHLFVVSILTRLGWTGARTIEISAIRQTLFQSSPVQVGRALSAVRSTDRPCSLFQSSPVRVGRVLLESGLSERHVYVSILTRPGWTGARVRRRRLHAVHLRFNPHPSGLDGCSRYQKADCRLRKRFNPHPSGLDGCSLVRIYQINKAVLFQSSPVRVGRVLVAGHYFSFRVLAVSILTRPGWTGAPRQSAMQGTIKSPVSILTRPGWTGALRSPHKLC